MSPDSTLDLMTKTRHIDGWFSLEAGMLFAWIDEIQKQNGVPGNIFEIGVHHGRSAVLLGSMLGAQETLGVCDLFGEQSGNVSKSGSGDRDVFENNMKTFLGEGVKIRVLAKPSTHVRAAEIGTGYRLFHIDGGHSPSEALNDLELAAAATVENGVIAIDDPMRPEWPGIAEAIVRFLSGNPQFCAAAIGFNKMILTRRTFADLYTREFDLTDQHAAHNILYPWRMKILDFVGHPARIFYVPTYLSDRSVRARLVRFTHLNPWARVPLLRPVFRLAQTALSDQRRRTSR
jgi:hypothetical protein